MKKPFLKEVRDSLRDQYRAGASEEASLYGGGPRCDLLRVLEAELAAARRFAEYVVYRASPLPERCPWEVTEEEDDDE